MKHLIYTHERVQSLAGWLRVQIAAIISNRLAPLIYQALPGRRGRRIAAGLLLLVSMVAQAFMLVLLAQLVDLCISLYELWAFMAGKFVEANE